VRNDSGSLATTRKTGLSALADWAVWAYAAAVVAISGSSGATSELVTFASIDRGAQSVEASAAGTQGPYAARATPGDWTNTRPSSGSALAPSSSLPRIPSAQTSSPLSGVAAPDAPRLSSGFLPDRALAPPRRA
jgi:hypothetical protein